MKIFIVFCIIALLIVITPRLFFKPKEVSGGIIFVGDSLVAGCNWARLFDNHKIINQRINGSTCADILRGLHVITGTKPSKVFLMVGSNDLYFGLSAAQVAGSYHKMVERILRESPDTKVYIHGIIPVNIPITGLPAYSNQVLQDMNARLKQIADELKVNYIELWPYFVKDGQLDRQFTFDGLHLNSSGYKRWKEAIIDLVNSP